MVGCDSAEAGPGNDLTITFHDDGRVLIALLAELGLHLLDRARFGLERRDPLFDPLVVDPGDGGRVLDCRDACGEHRRCHSGQMMSAPDEATTGNQVAAPVGAANTINDD